MRESLRKPAGVATFPVPSLARDRMRSESVCATATPEASLSASSTVRSALPPASRSAVADGPSVREVM
jgi:hypothetical protein